jgi:hypothetical protein
MFLLQGVCGFQDGPASKISSVFRGICLEWWLGRLVNLSARDRKYVRKLEYLGCHWDPREEADDHPFFRLGNTYTSQRFNGATYLVEGWDHRIGLAWFRHLKKPRFKQGLF